MKLTRYSQVRTTRYFLRALWSIDLHHSLDAVDFCFGLYLNFLRFICICLKPPQTVHEHRFQEKSKVTKLPVELSHTRSSVLFQKQIIQTTDTATYTIVLFFHLWLINL